MALVTLGLDQLRTDGGTQQRVKIPEEVVREYAEWILAKKTLPPVIAFFDGTFYWLADGFIRALARKACQKDEIEVDVRKGTQRDAILYSCGANAEHGLPRTREDKRQAVAVLLADEEWATWSDRRIAEAAGVGPDLVGTMRQLSFNDSCGEGEAESRPPQKRVGRDGKSRWEPPRKKIPPEMVVEANGECPHPEPDRLVDGLGIPVQPHAAEAFESRPLFDDLLAVLKHARHLYAQLAETPGGQFLQEPVVAINARDKFKSKGIENAILAIEDRRPHMTVCPFEYAEGGHPADCGLCKGRLWTLPFGKTSVPPELVSKAKEAFLV